VKRTLKNFKVNGFGCLVVAASQALALVACGEIEKSNYRDPNSVGLPVGSSNTPNSNSQNSSSPTSENSKAQESSGSKVDAPIVKDPGSETQNAEFDFDFETGLSKCVKQVFEGTNQPLFVTRRIAGTTEQWKSKSSLDDSNVWQAYDVVLRNIVSSETGKVRYSELREGGSWSSLWKKIVAGIENASIPSGAKGAESLAFWVNIYNAFMIDILVNDSSAISNPIKRNFTFGSSLRNVGGYNVSLNQIEYGVLGLNQQNQQTPVPEELHPNVYERRLHFALVCGATSCPKLRNFAYDGKQMFTILNENAHMFFNDSVNHVRTSSVGSSSPVQVSELFSWFAKDFNSMRNVDNPGSNSEFLKTECRSDTPIVSSFFQGFSSFKDLSSAQKIPYDWTVNELF
jgi:hypothetical protein